VVEKQPEAVGSSLPAATTTLRVLEVLDSSDSKYFENAWQRRFSWHETINL
jgi:hypothetical protein